ncbi:hypothetical protein [Vulgatibacter sp.]|uniref:hypothetical protein n=1 Tax=Vulgatibacter sp. TaxID=1971226 RepID=UPI00356881E1
MEERTSTDFPTVGSQPSGLSQLEATDRGDTLGTGEEGGVKEKVSGKAHDYAAQGKEQARKLGGVARERAIKSADSRKSLVASELDNFAGTLEEVSRTLESRGNESQRKLVDRGAKLVRQASHQLRDRPTEDLLDMAQEQLRARPGAAIAGAFALGFLGMRLLRS